MGVIVSLDQRQYHANLFQIWSSKLGTKTQPPPYIDLQQPIIPLVFLQTVIKMQILVYKANEKIIEFIVMGTPEDDPLMGLFSCHSALLVLFFGIQFVSPHLFPLLQVITNIPLIKHILIIL